MKQRVPSIFSLSLIVFTGFVLGFTLIDFLMKPLFGVGLVDFYAEFQMMPQAYHTAGHRFVACMQQVFMFLIPGIYFYRRYKRQEEAILFIPQKHQLLLIPAVLFFLYPVVALSTYVGMYLPFGEWFPSNEMGEIIIQQMILEADGVLTPYFNVFLLCMLPAVGEELIFRYALQGRILGAKMAPESAIFLTAFIFSAIHMEALGFLPRLVMGLVLGYVYHYSQNILVPMILHALNNYMSILSVKAGGLFFENWLEDLLGEGSMLVLFLFVVGAVNVILLLPRFKSQMRIKKPLPIS